MAGSVTVSGAVTFDLVPFNTVTNGLNYNAISQEPVRGVTVEAIDAAGTVLATGQSDANGNYSLTVDSNTNMRVRALAEIVQTGQASFDVSVVDNTNNNAVYAVQGALSSSGTANSVRNLNADSGWGGSSYTSTRAAGPFAILDAAYESVTGFVAVAPDVTFPELMIGWSTENRAVSGDSANGDIGTSSYVGNGVSGMVFILGDENADTDEYDRHVIVHEWGHYFEDRISRSDSPGGPHTLGFRLDARLAMGEGWGNALSGIITDDSIYRDSSGFQQSQGFSFDVEDNNNFNEGWFSEGSVQSIIYDLYDGDNDGADSIELGLGPIYEALIDDVYINQPTFTTIYSFVDQVRTESPSNVADINALVEEQSIFGAGFDGEGETNDGGISVALPLYNVLTVNGAPTELCSVDDETLTAEFSRIGGRTFARFDIAVSGNYIFSAVQTSGDNNRDPIVIIPLGNGFAFVLDSDELEQSVLLQLDAGGYSLEFRDENNISDVNTGDSCYNLSIVEN